MNGLRISLLGRFQAESDDSRSIAFGSLNAQKLFSYLLLFHGRPHRREKVADALWRDASASQAKSYLRKALWQLQSRLSEHQIDPTTMLEVDNEWIRLNLDGNCYLDLVEFEQFYEQTRGVQGTQMAPYLAQRLEGAVELYHGELLEGWYEEWCLLERERLLRMYLIMLDKLIAYCEAHYNYEAGLTYCMIMLHHDRAHERTHRRLMRLHFAAGNRSAALQQYEQCVTFLQEELGVAPSPRTTALFREIRSGQPLPSEVDDHAGADPASLQLWYQQLLELESALDLIRSQVHQDLETLALLFQQPNRPSQSQENG